VIKFVSYLRQIGGFLQVLRFPQPVKFTVRHDIAEILLKVALSTIKPNHLHKDVTDRGLWYHVPFNVGLLKGASLRSQKIFQTKYSLSVKLHDMV
jgi:hypothetical protein